MTVPEKPAKKSWLRRQFPITASVTKITTILTTVIGGTSGLFFAGSAAVVGAPIFAAAGIGLLGGGLVAMKMAFGVVLPAFVGSLLVEVGIKSYKENYAKQPEQKKESNDNLTEQGLKQESGDLTRSPNSKIAELDNVIREDFEEAQSNDNDIEKIKKFEPKPAFSPQGLGM